MKRSILWLMTAAICLAIAPQNTFADGIFTDEQLEAVVRKYVFDKRNNDEPLVEDDVANISTIRGRGLGIKDLNGLEKCRSLADLDLSDNKIESIVPMANLKNLQSLNLANNKIKDLRPLQSLEKLQYVKLADNQISNISPLVKLKNLRSLYLSNNKVKDLSPLANQKMISSLYLDGNQIDNISPIARLAKLDRLDLSRNQVSSLAPLKELTEWKYLFLDENRISDLRVLVAMGTKDKQGAQRFARFWQIYLKGNPLSDEARTVQLAQLRKVSKSVAFEEK